MLFNCCKEFSFLQVFSVDILNIYVPQEEKVNTQSQGSVEIPSKLCSKKMRVAADKEEIARTRGYRTHNWNVSQLEEMFIRPFITHLHEWFDASTIESDLVIHPGATLQ
jgi:hypothetical protein